MVLALYILNFVQQNSFPRIQVGYGLRLIQENVLILLLQ